MAIASRIADTIDVPGLDSLPILEIGPGTGVLTRFLLEKTARSNVWNSTLNQLLTSMPLILT